MRSIAVLVIAIATACGSDTTAPRPSERFAGTWSLESFHGNTLPVEIITPSDTLVRRAMMLEVTAEKYLPEAMYTDSLVKIERPPTGGMIVTNRSDHRVLTGFVSGDTVTFRQSLDAGPILRFVLEDPTMPVQLDAGGSPVGHVWSRR